MTNFICPSADPISRDQAMRFTRSAEAWAECYQRGEVLKCYADWARNRAEQAWDEYYQRPSSGPYGMSFGTVPDSVTGNTAG